MKGIKIGLIGVGLLLLIYLLIGRPTDPPKETSTKKEIIERPKNPILMEFLDSLDIKIQESFEKSEVPGIAVVIVHQGEVVYKKAFGVKVKNGIYPIDTNTVFRLASVSKGFSAVLTGILVSDSLLHWDDKVKEHLPWFSLKTKKHTEGLTIEHILSHTSGLQYQAYTTLVEDGWERDEMIKELKNVRLISNLGQVYSYQNVAYSIIEPIIEHVTGDDFNEVMQERIFGPLNMKDASMDYETFTQNNNIAKPHIYRGSSRHRGIKISSTYYNVAAAGGINASISDMGKWLQALTGHHPVVVSQPVLNHVFTPYVRTSLMAREFRRINTPARAYYGMGWRVVELPQDTIVYHGGYANGYRSGIAISQKEDIGICILTNSSLDIPADIMADFFDLFYQKADTIKSWRYENVF